MFSHVSTFLSVFLVQSSYAALRVDPLVNTNAGLIRGVQADDGDYAMFLGIPYGQVNISNPFGAPIPYPAFNDTFDANDDSAKCPQILNGNPIGTLDCLQLNIFVPNTANRNNRLPVMVFIYGGSFERGFKSKNKYGPKFLVRHDVIYIAINYRTGAYGFLCLDIPEVPGNQGLKDQVLAFRWIKENIEAFGGNSSAITAFGLSAGAHSIDFHIISDTEPLFENAIMQSGTALASTVFVNHDKTAPVDIASHLGFQTDSVHEAITFLSTVDSDDVVEAWTDLGIKSKPCTEMKFDNVESFLTRPWVNADTPKSKGMSILTGFTEQELLKTYVSPEDFENLNIIADKLNATFNFDEEQFTAMHQSIKNFYFGDAEINYDTMWPTINFDSDYSYIHPIQRSINKHLENGAKNVFYYMFTYNGGRNLGKYQDNVTIGTASHGDELGYLFDVDILVEERKEEDQLLIERMTTMWTNFAKYSDPTPETTSLLPIRWPSISSGTYNYLDINSEMVVGRRPLHERMSFWDLFYKYNEIYQKELIKLKRVINN